MDKEDELFQKQSHSLAYTYKSKVTNQEAVKSAFAQILAALLPILTVKNLLAISPEVYKGMVKYLCTHHIPAITTNLAIKNQPPRPVHIEYSTLLCKIKVRLNGTHKEFVLLDEGSEVVMIHEDVLTKCEAPINLGIYIHMQIVIRATQLMLRCMEKLEIEVARIRI